MCATLRYGGFALLYVLACFVTPSTSSVAYNAVSVTVSDLSPCLNTCSDDGQCYIDHHLNVANCYKDRLAGVPTYFTPLKKGSRQRCLSNCGKFGGSDYNWCYTTENYDWDYCNPVPYSPTEVWGRSIYGDKCIDDCVRSPYSTPKCHVASQAYVTCARPAIVPVQSCQNIFASNSTTRTKRSPLDRVFWDACSQACRLRVRDGYAGETMQRMQDVLAQNYPTYPVEVIRHFPDGSPYTFVATRNETNSLGEEVYLPLVVQATLRRPTVPPRTSDDVPEEAANNTANMYDGDNRGRDTGHIIAFINGGTRDLFNFVSQTVATNRGPYKVIETFIKNWIYSGLGYAELTVVVEYAGTTVTEFAVKLKMFNNDGSVHSDCLDIIINNI